MTPALEALFVEAAPGNGRRLYLHHRPPQAARSAVLFVHAFAEEMHKSRRMAALAARAMAAAGHAVLQLDLAGCGDSSGPFSQATWSRWLDDARQARQWLRERHPGRPLVLWGHRAGALLATELAQDDAASLLLWQPPANGKSLLQQFMRLRVAAGLADGPVEEAGAGREVMRAMRDAWQAGDTVTIAGYDVSPGLAHGLEAAVLRAPPSGARVAWLEVSPRDPAELLPASSSTIERWRQAGHVLHAAAVSGPAFWQTVEIEDAPELAAASVGWLDASFPAPGVDAGVPPAAGPVPAETTGARPGERPLCFDCDGERLFAIVSEPTEVRGAAVLIVVGGPQYRAGSHRQFVHLARALADAGHPAMRFDVRGMGDATGPQHTFEHIGADIDSALEAFQRELPAATPIVLWGLCDGASAALMALPGLSVRAAGVALANPWVRSEATLARTHVKHYYRQRLLEREFWLKLLRGGVGAVALRGLLRNFRLSRTGSAPVADFRTRMVEAAATFDGPTLLLLSERDITAREFDEYTAADARWQAVWQRRRPQRVDLAGADHTFSSEVARVAAETATIEWLARSGGARR